MCFVAPLVEGNGEIEAVPKLLHRLFKEVKQDSLLLVNPPIRIKSASFLQDENYFRKYIELAARKAKSHIKGSVLILMDCEDDCPAAVGCNLLERAQKIHADVTFLVALAYREYETWFLAAASSLRGIGGLPVDLEPPPNPEAIRGAKEWLGERMPTGYDPVNHQPLFTAEFSFEAASDVSSFSRLRQRIKTLFV